MYMEKEKTLEVRHFPSKKKRKRRKKRKRIKLESKMIEHSKSFRLYMTSKLPNPPYTP